MTKKPVLHGIVFKEGDMWVARCLDIDHTAQARTPQSAIKECIDGLLHDIQFAIEHDTLEYLKPAPISEKMRIWWERPEHEYRPREIDIPAKPTGGHASSRKARVEFIRPAGLVPA